MNQKCSECKAEEWCRHTFGKYYCDKSHGGEGCNYPLPQDERTVRDAMRIVRQSPSYNPF